ncbi:hypothetical protein JL720_11646 [Aureococcus anophagefferens]|nr:hypothetical protein JL720_11646 [Aureococcus anophagefferens]
MAAATAIKRIESAGAVDRLPWMSKGDVCIVDAATARVTKLGDLAEAAAGLRDDDVSAFWCSRDGRELYAATARQLLRRWTLTWEGGALTGCALACTVRAHRAPVRCVGVGVRVPRGGVAPGGFVKVMDARRSCCVTHSFAHGGGVVEAVAHHPDRATRVLLSVCGAFVHLWDLASSAKLRSFDHGGAVAAAAWLPGLKASGDLCVAAAARDGTLRVWDGRTGALGAGPVEAREDVAGLVALDGDDARSRRFATCGSSGRVRAWRVATSRAPTASRRPARAARRRASRRWRRLGRRSSPSAPTRPAASSTRGRSRRRGALCGCGDEILGVAYAATSAAGDVLAIATNSERLRVVDAATWSTTFLGGHADAILAVDCLRARPPRDGVKDRTCRVWELRDGAYEPRAVLVGHVDAVGAALGAGAAGPFAVSASRDRTLKRWPLDAAQPRAAASVVAHDKDAHCVAVAPKGSSSRAAPGKTAKLWDPETLELRGALAGHKRGVWRCAFSATERWLATCSSDKTVKVWAVASLQCLATLQGHEDSVLALAFLGGDQLVSGSADGVLKVWSPKTSTCECTVEAHAGARPCAWTGPTAWTALRDLLKRATGAAVDDPYDGVVAAWDLATARKCLGFAAEWNTNATRAPVAQRVLRAVVKRFGADAALRDAASRDALAAYAAPPPGRPGPVEPRREARDNPAPAARQRCRLRGRAGGGGGDDDDDDSDAPPPPKKTSAKKKKKKKGALVCFVSLASDAMPRARAAQVAAGLVVETFGAHKDFDSLFLSSALGDPPH